MRTMQQIDGHARLAPEFNSLKDCRYGRMLFNVNDCYVGRSYDLYGEWKENELKLLSRIIRPGWVVLDIGANIGQHTIFFAQAVGHQGAVLAFEPQRIFHQTLCANMALNHVARAYCHHQAVGSTLGSIEVPVRQPWLQKFNFAALTLKGVEYEDTEKVPLITVDSLGLGRCHFMKVEVVGMEIDVLQGAVHTIREHRPILFVENDSIGVTHGSLAQPDNEERSCALIRFIDALGYDMYWHVAPYFNPDNFFENSTNVFGRSAALNMLCVPRGHGHNISGLKKVDVPGTRRKLPHTQECWVRRSPVMANVTECETKATASSVPVGSVRVLAYIALRYDYFNFHLKHQAELGFTVFPLDFYALLHQMQGKLAITPENYRAVLDQSLAGERFSALWCYNRPDEVTLAWCRDHRVPVVAQESFGNVPYPIPCIQPLSADLGKALGVTAAAGPARPRTGRKVTTLALSLTSYGEADSVPSTLSHFDGQHIPLGVFWQPSPHTGSNVAFVRAVAEVWQQCPELHQSCELRVRIHPRYPMKFMGCEGITVDTRPVVQALAESDVILCTNSGLGIDGLRAGCEVITFEERAFFAHPQLTRSPKTADALLLALRESLHGTGRQPLVDCLVKAYEGPLRSSCQPTTPEDSRQTGAAIRHAMTWSMQTQVFM